MKESEHDASGFPVGPVRKANLFQVPTMCKKIY